ncbi:MAG: hypothetical protein MJ245_04465 [Clostridia bacterium]|nr:hypothetical protein [Clostridia bacterium]
MDNNEVNMPRSMDNIMLFEGMFGIEFDSITAIKADDEGYCIEFELYTSELLDGDEEVVWSCLEVDYDPANDDDDFYVSYKDKLTHKGSYDYLGKLPFTQGDGEDYNKAVVIFKKLS